MAVRLKGKHEHNIIALTVIWFLGTIALFSSIMSGALIHRAISYEGIDAAVVALIGQQVSISTLALGALGAMLSSTSPKPAPPPTADGSTPVTVVNPMSDPVPTEPVVEDISDAEVVEDLEEVPEEPVRRRRR